MIACMPISDSCISKDGNGCRVANAGGVFPPAAPMKSPMTLTSGLSAFAAAEEPPYTGTAPEFGLARPDCVSLGEGIGGAVVGGAVCAAAGAWFGAAGASGAGCGWAGGAALAPVLGRLLPFRGMPPSFRIRHRLLAAAGWALSTDW